MPALNHLSELEEEAREGARRLTLAWIDRVAETRERARTDADAVTALHDLRVALTRLRATLRLYHRELEGGLGARETHRLARLNGRLGRIRDLDVQCALLQQDGAELPQVARDGSDWLHARLSRKRAQRATGLETDLTRSVDDRIAGWRDRLAHYQVRRVVGVPVSNRPLAAVVANRLQHAMTRLHASIRTAGKTPSAEALHRLRIAIKRVRALLVPWIEAVPDLSSLYATLSRGQEQLGRMRDAALLSARARRYGTRHPEATTALDALADHYRDIETAVRVEFLTSWLVSAGGGGCLKHGRATAALDALARGATEIERKFLLRAAPPEALAVPGVRIAQGWIPGERLRERLRRSVYPDGTVRWTRTVKIGTGIERLELEEPTDPMLFETLWPLTSRERVEKIRHAVPDDSLTWEIDVFLDRALVLAEVELPEVDTAVILPSWLAPYVEREVTGEPAFVNANLARETTRTERVP
jgi:CHAD domain-containing protein/CYTH domain-containing protein